MKTLSSAAVLNSDRARFSKEIAALSMKLRERVMRLKPGTAAVPGIWRWGEVRPPLARAFDLIAAKQAERRVSMLEGKLRSKDLLFESRSFASLRMTLPHILHSM